MIGPARLKGWLAPMELTLVTARALPQGTALSSEVPLSYRRKRAGVEPATIKADRERFVTREETDRLLAACPNMDWRVIVALCRFGGLRCPERSAHLGMDGR